MLTHDARAAAKQPFQASLVAARAKGSGLVSRCDYAHDIVPFSSAREARAAEGGEKGFSTPKAARASRALEKGDHNMGAGRSCDQFQKLLY